MSIYEIIATATTWYETFVIFAGDKVIDIMNSFVPSRLYSKWKEMPILILWAKDKHNFSNPILRPSEFYTIVLIKGGNRDNEFN